MENNDLISRSELIQLFTDLFNKVETDEFGETYQVGMLNLKGVTKVINECPASVQITNIMEKLDSLSSTSVDLRSDAWGSGINAAKDVIKEELGLNEKERNTRHPYNCGNCTRRQFYQKGYEAGLRDKDKREESNG